jgi:hypothetical protein
VIVGTTTLASPIAGLRVPDRIRTTEYVFPDCVVAKWTAYMDGLGGVDADAFYRPVIYTTGGALLGVGPEVVVPVGQAAQWVDMPFAWGGVPLAAGTYRIGSIVGGGQTSRFYYQPEAGLTTYGATDTYADGPASSVTFTAFDAYRRREYATVFPAFAPADLPDMELARLPYAEAQASLGGPGPALGVVSASLGWHGTLVDPERGSFAVVREGGPLERLLGERVLLTYRASGVSRSVVAYVHNKTSAVEDDISLTRALFTRLAPLALAPVTTQVRVIG